NKAFKDEAVLQENIIIMLQKNVEQENVKISYCNDDSFVGLSEFEVPFNNILLENGLLVLEEEAEPQEAGTEAGESGSDPA
ncbi:MAG: hypothetical protein J6X35_06880, partial [Bacteroidales bacterium]|nr:hypothetical protein [Bacteroidales bacterium]